ncbi:MAG: glycoside hydrolase family 5 protein [Planctomycetes bacterium]|nr:glycoside hydrolase family 5 protein [Planctomycetota bacterium]
MRKARTSRVSRTALAAVLWCSAGPLYAGLPWLHVEGNKIKDPRGQEVMLRGISLIDLGYTESRHGGVLQMIDRITDPHDPQGSSPGWYPTVVRLPICPPDAGSGAPLRWQPNEDSFYRDLLRPVVNSCAKKNLYVILDWHYVSDTGPKVAQTSAFWRYMAPRFAHDSHVLFELFNEPMNQVGAERESWLSVRKDMQTWVDIVRTYASDNLILVGGPRWCQILAPMATDPVAGSNIVYVSHYYPVHWLGNDRKREWVTNQLQTCAAVHPILMTEWGFTTTTETLLNGTISNYGRPLMDLVERLGIGHMAWAASYEWGPPMFRRDWTLRCGEGEMGGFVKDTLYQKRDDRPPQQNTGNTP